MSNDIVYGIPIWATLSYISRPETIVFLSHVVDIFVKICLHAEISLLPLPFVVCRRLSLGSLCLSACQRVNRRNEFVIEFLALFPLLYLCLPFMFSLPPSLTIPCYICCSSLILILTRFLLDISNFIYAYYIQHLVTFLCICNYKGVQGVKPSFLAPSRRLVAEINALMCSALIIFTFSSHLPKQWP